MQIQYKNFGTRHSARSYHYEGKHEYVAHTHQFIEIVCILSGEIEITVENLTQTATAGDIAIIPPLYTHSYHTPNYCKIWIGLISLDWLYDIMPNDSIFMVKQTIFTPSPVFFNYIAEKTPPPYSMHTDDTMSPELYRRTKVFYHSILNEYLDNAKINTVEHHPNIIATVYMYIYNHYRENITLKKLAADIGYTSTYISHCLASIPDKNFRTILNSARIEHAKKLLASTDMRIIDIALESGFASENVFYGIFEKFTGMTPRKYRLSKNAADISPNLSMLP
ncbi:MAG: helix-turn-helix domain-containing protein [Clostridia bacterium]|nr:helix-turn-helix domain-containing protein [Clostridia bacterium]